MEVSPQHYEMFGNYRPPKTADESPRIRSDRQRPLIAPETVMMAVPTSYTKQNFVTENNTTVNVMQQDTQSGEQTYSNTEPSSD